MSRVGAGERRGEAADDLVDLLKAKPEAFTPPMGGTTNERSGGGAPTPKERSNICFSSKYRISSFVQQHRHMRVQNDNEPTTLQDGLQDCHLSLVVNIRTSSSYNKERPSHATFEPT